MKMKRLTKKIYNSSKDHNRESWMRVVYYLYLAGGAATTSQLAQQLNHKPPRSTRRATQFDTNVAFIDYCVKNGWLA
jgi:hypothetical protein